MRGEVSLALEAPPPSRMLALLLRQQTGRTSEYDAEVDQDGYEDQHKNEGPEVLVIARHPAPPPIRL